MKTSTIPLLGVLALLPGYAASSLAGVEVEFVAPEKFTDAGLDGYGDAARATTLDALRKHMEKLGLRCLAPDRTLHVRFTDVDLAGRLKWSMRSGTDLRVLTDATWPSMNLSWKLTDSNGRVVEARDERIHDMAYLSHRPFLDLDASMPYDRQLLTHWYEERFCPAKDASAP